MKSLILYKTLSKKWPCDRHMIRYRSNIPLYKVWFDLVFQINALSEASERKAKRLPTQQQMARIRNMKLKKRMDRTSRIMIAVLLLFLATEFPQGILGLLSGILGKCFFRTCYNLFGELMDMLALLNASLNFVFYCCMSKQFRVAFGQLFKNQPIIIFKPSNQCMQETFV